jgi:hypothetical protein
LDILLVTKLPSDEPCVARDVTPGSSPVKRTEVDRGDGDGTVTVTKIGGPCDGVTVTMTTGLLVAKELSADDAAVPSVLDAVVLAGSNKLAD